PLHGEHVPAALWLGLVRLVGLHLAPAGVDRLDGWRFAQAGLRVDRARLADHTGDLALVEHQRLGPPSTSRQRGQCPAHRAAPTTTADPPNRAASRLRVASGSSITPASRSPAPVRSEEHTSELQSRENLVCRLLLEKKKQQSR